MLARRSAGRERETDTHVASGDQGAVVQSKGACHRCSAEFRDTSKMTQCSTCQCRFHVHDCGKRIQQAGLEAEKSAQCPKCCNLCFCAGGPVACHTGRTKRRREGAAQHKALAAAARAAGPATGPGPGVALLPFGAAAAGLLIPGDPTLASFLMSPAQQHDRGLGGGAAGGAAPPGYPPNASAGADLTQAIQVTAARALIACAPAALGGAANPTVVTAANAAAAAYSVTLMSCFVAPHAVAQHAPPAGATAAGPTAPGSDLSRWYADMALFQQRQQLAPHNAHAAAALMRRPQPPAAAVAVAAPGGAGLMNGTVETTGMAPYKNGDGNGNGNGTAGAPVANGDAHTLH